MQVAIKKVTRSSHKSIVVQDLEKNKTCSTESNIERIAFLGRGEDHNFWTPGEGQDHHFWSRGRGLSKIWKNEFVAKAVV